MDQRRLRRCRRCGELRGEAVVEDRCEGIVRVQVACVCSGTPCPRCGKRLVRRPISNHYDEYAGAVWHTPRFGYHSRCASCRRSGELAGQASASAVLMSR
jgi:hypothetical protein